MAQRFYPAVIFQAGGDGPEDGYDVVFPDVPGCTSTGATVEEAARHAVDALADHLGAMVDAGEPVPAPTIPAPMPLDLAQTGSRVVAQVLVPVDMPGRAVRLSITVDEGLVRRLDAAAEADGYTHSGLIAQAVRERLHRAPDGARPGLPDTQRTEDAGPHQGKRAVA